jgi:hypothetical protein
LEEIMLLRKILVSLIATALASILAGTAQALVITGDTATASTMWDVSTSPVRAVNSQGLSTSENPNDPNPPRDTPPFATHDTNFENMWMADSSGVSSQTFTVDLNAVYGNIIGFHVWNFNQDGNTDRGIQSVTIRYSATAEPATIADGNLLGTFTFAQAFPNTNLYAGEDFPLATPITARFVKLFVHTHYGDSGNFVGLSEIQFSVPEPGSLALLALGFALVVRRRPRMEEVDSESACVAHV